MLPRVVRTYPFTDENGNRVWKVEDESCVQICIQGKPESMSPEVCPWYQNLNGKELCHVEDCDSCG